MNPALLSEQLHRGELDVVFIIVSGATQAALIPNPGHILKDVSQMEEW